MIRVEVPHDVMRYVVLAVGLFAFFYGCIRMLHMFLTIHRSGVERVAEKVRQWVWWCVLGVFVLCGFTWLGVEACWYRVFNRRDREKESE